MEGLQENGVEMISENDLDNVALNDIDGKWFYMPSIQQLPAIVYFFDYFVGFCHLLHELFFVNQLFQQSMYCCGGYPYFLNLGDTKDLFRTCKTRGEEEGVFPFSPVTCVFSR